MLYHWSLPEDPIVLAISVSNSHNVKGDVNRPVFIGGQNRVIHDRSWALVFDSLFLRWAIARRTVRVYLLERKQHAMPYMPILCLLAFCFAGFKSEMV